MKLFLLILFSYVIIFPASYGQKACPLNLDSQRIKQVEKDLSRYQGKVVAFEANVIDIKEGNVGKPFYKVVLGDEYLWIAGHGQMGDISKGQKLRILGLICLWTNDSLNEKYNDKKYFILSLAHINMETKMASVFPDAISEYDIWTKGQIPDGYE
jgi:hypothetical protein